jgi:hypothetical protein
MSMIVQFLERDHGHLADSDDGQKALGKQLMPGVTTVGAIREQARKHSPDASIRVENDGSGFYITEIKHKFFCG